jgi:16S rRNA processing protein RimM
MVVMGRVTAPFGVKGWIRIYALTAHPGNLCDYPVWWLRRGDDWRAGDDWRKAEVVAAKLHSNTLVAQLAGIESREAAAALKGLEIGVPRSQLPAAAGNEFYWADLIGLKVVNMEEHELGRVARIVQTGANDVLVVASEKSDERELLVPFIADAIKEVNIAAGVIAVDWGRDY